MLTKLGRLARRKLERLVKRTPDRSALDNYVVVRCGGARVLFVGGGGWHVAHLPNISNCRSWVSVYTTKAEGHYSHYSDVTYTVNLSKLGTDLPPGYNGMFDVVIVDGFLGNHGVATGSEAAALFGKLYRYMAAGATLLVAYSDTLDLAYEPATCVPHQLKLLHRSVEDYNPDRMYTFLRYLK